MVPCRRQYSRNRQLLVQDGYLLRMFENFGQQAAPSSGRIVG
jgi:hypothetical protein